LLLNVVIFFLRFNNVTFFYFIILAVADAIRTSLGPKGMDKMVIIPMKSKQTNICIK